MSIKTEIYNYDGDKHNCGFPEHDNVQNQLEAASSHKLGKRSQIRYGTVADVKILSCEPWVHRIDWTREDIAALLTAAT